MLADSLVNLKQSLEQVNRLRVLTLPQLEILMLDELNPAGQAMAVLFSAKVKGETADKRAVVDRNQGKSLVSHQLAE